MQEEEAKEIVLSEDFKNFLIEAKENVYLNGSRELREYGGNQMVYDGHKDFLLVNEYRGFLPFCGLETVYKKDNNSPIWCLSYYGQPSNKEVPVLDQAESFFVGAGLVPAEFNETVILQKKYEKTKEIDYGEVLGFLDYVLRNPDPNLPLRGVLMNSLTEKENVEKIKRDSLIYHNIIDAGSSLSDFAGIEIIGYVLNEKEITPNDSPVGIINMAVVNVFNCRYQGGIIAQKEMNDLFR
ncbi:MAG: hypothetical protein KKB03_04730 [Nanoarchaeota archaeon]|nr:hypothetical protein [Nanoarchaeota archaeon]MBU1135365.1 hypothetical protein [Nanoarchaeota archaeon]MBU2520516.1 hypothetical protein [Nanoarchaeota archaeon]